MNQKSQFYNSAYDFYKTMLARQAGAAYVKPEVVPEDKTEKEVVEKPEVKPEVKSKVVKPVDPVPPVVEEVNWAEIGKQHGLYSSKQVKELQKKLGLPETGNLDDATLERKAWYDKMKELGYTETALNGQPIYFMHGNNKFYMDGTSVIGGRSGTYDYTRMQKITSQPTTTSAPIKFTKEHFLNSPLFADRNFLFNKKSNINYLFKNGATDYLLRTGSNLDKSGKYGIKHNALYAYDEKTGKIRQVKTDIFGVEQYGDGDLLWEGNWFDVSKALEDPEQTWLAKNPKPSEGEVAYVKNQW
jgi:hypothetical protein